MTSATRQRLMRLWALALYLCALMATGLSPWVHAGESLGPVCSASPSSPASGGSDGARGLDCASCLPLCAPPPPPTTWPARAVTDTAIDLPPAPAPRAVTGVHAPARGPPFP